MPIEIREVVIRAVIEPPGGGGGGGEAPQGGGNQSGTPGGDADAVSASVKKVMEILREKEER